MRHEHGGAPARASLAIFTVKNGGKKTAKLSAASIALIEKTGERTLELKGVSFEDQSPGTSVKIGPGETRTVRVHCKPVDVYMAGIGSFFRWSVVFESGGEKATATVPLRVVRMEPLHR